MLIPDTADGGLKSFFFTTSEPPGLSPRSTNVDVISAAANTLCGNGCEAIINNKLIGSCLIIIKCTILNDNLKIKKIKQLHLMRVTLNSLGMTNLRP